TGIVRAGDYGHKVPGNIHPILQALRMDSRKVLANAVFGDVRTQIQEDIGHVFAEHLVVNTARHHITWGQVAPLRVIVLHERRATQRLTCPVAWSNTYAPTQDSGA